MVAISVVELQGAVNAVRSGVLCEAQNTEVIAVEIPEIARYSERAY